MAPTTYSARGEGLDGRFLQPIQRPGVALTASRVLENLCLTGTNVRYRMIAIGGLFGPQEVYMAKGKLSDRQRDMLDFIGKFTQEKGYPPTIRQIGEAVDISSTSVVNYNLNNLEKGVYIARDPKASRGVRGMDSDNFKFPYFGDLIIVTV